MVAQPPQLGGQQQRQPLLAEIRQDILQQQPIIRFAFNFAEWGDVFGHVFRMALANYFVFRYLSYTRAIMASLFFLTFFLANIGFFSYVDRALGLGLMNANRKMLLDYANHFLGNRNAQQQPPAQQGENLVPAANPENNAQRPDPTLLKIVVEGIVGFFTSMIPDNIPEREQEQGLL